MSERSKNSQEPQSAYPNAFASASKSYKHRIVQLVSIVVSLLIVGGGLYLILGEDDTTDTSATPQSVESGMEAVDMGLGVRWASMNVGAESPAEEGGFFAWGESEPRTTFGWRDSKSYDRPYPRTLSHDADAAATVLGDGWRMPTDEELLELVEKCEWREAERDGCYGFEVIADNGNSIFLPAAGYSYDTLRYHNGLEALYWSASSVAEGDDKRALALRVNNHEALIESYYRYYGAPIRAVKE